MELRLKSQDVVIALKIVALENVSWTQPELAKSLHMSASEVNHGLKRLAACHLFHVSARRTIRAGLLEFLVHGIRYVFPATLGGMTRGIPTSYAAPPLREHFVRCDESQPVWPDPKGTIRGESLEPLYRSVPRAAQEDKRFYELLVLVDAMRSGRARERELATRELRTRLK